MLRVKEFLKKYAKYILLGITAIFMFIKIFMKSGSNKVDIDSLQETRDDISKLKNESIESANKNIAESDKDYDDAVNLAESMPDAIEKSKEVSSMEDKEFLDYINRKM